jgi:hypothetical protein
MAKALEPREPHRYVPSHRHVSAARPQPEATIVLRRLPGGSAVLERLAALDSARPSAGDHLVAEIDGVAAAAVPLDGGRTIADPFLPTAGAVKLLTARAAQLQQAADGARRVPHGLRRARTALR